MSSGVSICPDGDLYLGISGIDLKFDRLDLGEGICLSKTKCTFLTGHMMVFESAKEEDQTDVPRSVRTDKDGSKWKDVSAETRPVSGLTGYDITGELLITKAASESMGQDQFALARWILSLMRMWSVPSLSAPVLSKQSLSLVLAAEMEELQQVLPFETQSRGIYLESDLGRSVTLDRLYWIRDSWKSGAKLANARKEFRLAVEALDQAHFVHDHALGVLLVWAALEGLFSPSRSELRFRTSALIASFLESPGAERRKLHREVTKLYDARSSAAHDRSSIDRAALMESMILLRRIIIKMISNCHVPSRDELEGLLFGG
mgnify:CR=1 FL=1|jgi:hypothetical protein